MPSITVKGAVHSFTETAPRKPKGTLVFIHGWLLSQKYWRPILDHLGAEYRCITYDLRGFGESQGSLSQYAPELSHRAFKAGKSYSNYDLVAYASDLDTLLRSLRLSEVWLVGHSLGGSIALWGGYCSPERVAGMICINSGGGIYVEKEFEKFRSAGQRVVEHTPSWLRYLPFLDIAFSHMMVHRPINRHWGRQRLLDLLHADKKAAIESLLASTTEEAVHHLPQIVSQLKQPAYFLAGLDDKVMEPRFVKHLASFHPMFQGHQNVLEIENCGHIAMLEQPDKVAEFIRFCVQNPGLSLKL